MGFAGCWKAGSSRSTTVWVSRQATRYDMPRRPSSPTTPPPHLGCQRFAEAVADSTLGVGHAHVEGETRSELRLGDELGAAEDEAHLRPVAVGEDDAPAPRGEGAHVDGGGAGVLALLVDGPALALAAARA